ncbi:unnamed protein product [Cyprideis torosa]|uniref:Uncharacterized protein n=1 Tax=Cyprideis torosa TaxID=163714 RepID=A0A7R8ZGI1_9CRUS|nr:unnamed protein product [Cyprideis torosa]CAG0881706.1 unnamed protein product [Cyprideis torosa]
MGSAESRYLTPFTRIRSGNRTRFFTPASLSATREQYLGTKGTKESDRFTSSNLDNRKFSADFSSVNDDSSGYIPLNLKETEQQPSTSVASGNSSSTRKSPGGTDMGRSESRSSSSGGEGSFRDIDERTKSLVFEYGDVQRSSEASRREPELMGDEFEQDSLKQGRANSLFETALRRVHSQSPRLNEQGDWEERSPVEEAESEEESEGRLKMVLDEEKQEEDAANNSDDEDSDFEGKEEKSRPAGPGDTPCFDSEAPPYDTYLAESFSKGTRTTYATPAASWNEEGQQNSNPLPPSCQEMVEQALSRLSGVTSTPASKSSTTLPIADRRGNRRGASGPSSAFVRYPRGPLNEDGSIECPDCGKVFTGRHRLVHIKEHKKKKKCIGGTQTGALRKKTPLKLILEERPGESDGLVGALNLDPPDAWVPLECKTQRRGPSPKRRPPFVQCFK